MIQESKIQQLIDEFLADKPDIFLVEMRVKTDNKIRVFIDSERGIKIEDCIALSRHIEGNLDREEEDFALDVSSAGLDLPLRIPRQFMKNIGRSVQVILINGEELEGEITEASDLEFTILPKKKKTKKKDSEIIIEPISIPYLNQKETKLILTF